jgi:Flp pilus assembly secretin CpaC
MLVNIINDTARIATLGCIQMMIQAGALIATVSPEVNTARVLLEELKNTAGNQRPAIFPGAGEPLFARASPATLEKGIDTANDSPQRIELQIRWTELSPRTAASFNLSATNSPKVLLTEKQSDDLLAKLPQTDNVDLLSMPKTVTLSGREAIIAERHTQTIVSEAASATGTSAESAQSFPLEVGPQIRVVPHISASDRNAIHIEAATEIIEFLGYTKAKTPSPLIRTNAATGSATVWDGQTFVLSMGSLTNIVHFTDGVPVLGDLPLIGTLFSTKKVATNITVRFVLITPRLIDAAGLPLNPEDNPPFDPKSFPKQ